MLIGAAIGLLLIYLKTKTKRATIKLISDNLKPSVFPQPVEKPQAPYKRRDMMSTVEQKLFLRLKTALHGHCDVHAQVALSRLLDVDKQRDITTFNQVAQKSVDFVITATTKDNNITTVAVIELDDKSHLAKNRQIADRVKNAALEQAGITLFRWTVKDMPDVETIQKLFLG
jgi:hypothetical protein